MGLGEEYRLASGKLAGAALVAEGRVAHLMVFPFSRRISMIVLVAAQGAAGSGK